MTTKELYRSIGVSGYEHQQCWRNDGVFHLRMSAPASCYRCPQCGSREVIHRGTVTESSMPLRSAWTGLCCSSRCLGWNVGVANAC